MNEGSKKDKERFVICVAFHGAQSDERHGLGVLTMCYGMHNTAVLFGRIEIA